jgi:ABC-type oligopeptide transport system ATPase subunit
VTALLEARGLHKHFTIGPLLGKRHVLRAVDGVDLDARRGEVLAVVGESGSGKTTLARLLLRLVEPTAGSIFLDGIDLTRLQGRALRAARARMQLVFQNPVASLNPRRRVNDVLLRPMLLRGIARDEAQRRVGELLETVGLDPRAAARYPHEFSGGQQQRIAIARALSTDPDLIVADEPVSALDASIQAQIVALIERLRLERHLTILLIAHDMALVNYLADRVVVMQSGRIVERGVTAEVLGRPSHPYTRQLVDAASRKSLSLAGRIAQRAAPEHANAGHSAPT